MSRWTQQTALRLHVARYAALLADPHAGFGAIMRFAGFYWDGARLGLALEHCAFPRLQAQEAESGFAEKQPTVPSFFAPGWPSPGRTALTAEQVRAVVAALHDVMARFGYLREAEAFLRVGKRDG